MKTKIITVLCLLSFPLFAQTEKEVVLETKTAKIYGTLVIPYEAKSFPVALIIAGSGPTDRNGNNPMMQNNSLKMLANGLAENGIASLRYDKRAIGESKVDNFNEFDSRFENFIDDTKSWIEFLRNDSLFNKIIVIGHSEGSLIGIIASENEKVDKLISLAGTGEPANLIIRKQLSNQPKEILDPSLKILDTLETGKLVNNVPQMLYSLFRPSIQPYLISWFKYNPQTEIAKLKIPILIVQGTTDIQVSVKDADELASANLNSEKIIIDGMNHILKESDLDRQKNIATYSNPELPLKDGLIDAISKFIKK
jgi:uncharacterized protein